MQRSLVVLAIALLAIALLATGCSARTSGGSGSASKADISLRISVWPSGPEGPVQRWTLECPANGTLPGTARACRLLAGRPPNVFAPVPGDVACTEIYGGPQQAAVTGQFRARPIATRFNRTNGCEIARWNRLRFLFPTRG